MSAPRLPGLRRASGSSLGAREVLESRFPNAGPVPCPAVVPSPASGSPPSACAPRVKAGNEGEGIQAFRDTNRLSSSDTSPSDNSISPFSSLAVLVVIIVITKQ